MNVWAISDLHLSFARPESRESIAGRWRDHAVKIAQHWDQSVRREDLVLIPGDISMARNHREVQPDLAWLDRRPGLKVLAPGNHDGWFGEVAKLRPMLRPSLRAVNGDAISLEGTIVCGTLGADVPEDDAPTPVKELERITRALEMAAALRLPGQPLYVLWHYPPIDQLGRPGPWVEVFEQHQVTACVYGHLHIEEQWSRAVQGVVGSVRYHCVAADSLGFRPLRISRESQPDNLYA